MDIEIRIAEKGDATIVAAISAATFYETYADTDDPGDLAEYVTREFSREVAVEALASPENTFFLAGFGGRIVGYAKFRRTEAPEAVGGLNAAEIQRIYIFSRFARKGIGRALIERCVKTAKDEGFEGIWLGVWDANTKALRFYERMGFEKVGKTEFLYGSQSFVNDLMLLRF